MIKACFIASNISYKTGKWFIIIKINVFRLLEIICQSGRTKSDLTTQGTGTALYLQNGNTLPLNNTNVIKVPLKRNHAIRDGWSKNNCFYGMGNNEKKRLLRTTMIII